MNINLKFFFNADILYMQITKSNNTIVLDEQSTGFKWFFNFYFNVIKDSKFNAGDIILIDEPGVHLHVLGQIELRKFISDFGIKNNILFVITTHSPFMIDLDNLDEIRILKYENNSGINVNICNDFSLIDDKKSNPRDTINAIKKALTINNNVLFDDDAKIVFVEGISDYNYFCTFKKELEKIYSKIYFIPICGIGGLKEHSNKIINQISNILNRKSYLLVDGDDLGTNIKEVIDNTNSKIKALTLKEIDNNFNTIESLLTYNNSDLLKTTPPKQSEYTRLIKKHPKNFKEYVNENTKKNFRKVFDYILELK